MQNAAHAWEDPAGGDTLARLLRLCEPGLPRRLPLTVCCAPGDPLATVWEHWVKHLFSPILVPAISQSYLLAMHGRGRDIQAFDLELDHLMEERVAERSREAGRMFLDRLRPARGERIWNKFQSWTRAGDTSGHFPIIFALHGACFHVPLFQTMMAYSMTEWRSALEESGAHWGEMPAKDVVTAVRGRLLKLEENSRFAGGK